MDTFTYFFFVCVLGLASIIDATEVSTTEHLDRRLREAKVEIAKAYFEREEPVPVVSASYDVQWQRLWREPLNTNRTLIMNIFDKMFVLNGNQIMSVIVKVDSINENSHLRNVIVIHQEHLVKFIRTIVWKATLYLLVCHEAGSCTLYTGKNDMQLQRRQTIRHRGLPMDAIFFTHANQLYLVVADNTGQFTVPSVIYRWAGTYMDVIKEVMTTGAVSVTVFKYKHSMIIVFAQNIKGNSKIGSKVYKFNQNGMELIQFLTTDSPVSVYSYDNDGYKFLLVINEMEPSDVFWWDGKELLDWLEFPNIKSPSLVNIVHYYGNTFFFVSQVNYIRLYNIFYLDFVKLDHIIELKDTKEILNMDVWVKDTSIVLILITISSNNLYQIELLEVRIRKLAHENMIKEIGVTMKCLSKLSDHLRDRMPVIENARNLWSSLLPSSENIVVTTPISIPNLIIDSGNILNIDVFVTEDILTPKELQNNIENLSREADEILATSRKIVQMNKTNLLTGNVIIEGDAIFDTLHVDSLSTHFLNDKKLEFNNIISSTKDQHFSSSLRGEDITVHELEIDSLCGIPFKHWQLKNNTLGTSLDIMASNVELQEDTIFVHSDLSLQDFKVNRLNHVDLQLFLNDLFIIGQNQVIKGNIHFRKSLHIANLTVHNLNGIPFDKLITKTTNQNLGNVFVRSLKIENLTADTINGVPVEGAARISQDNVIKGEVTIANLYITENLVFDSDVKLPNISSVQIYDNVTIVGDLFVKHLDLKTENSLILNGVKTDINRLFEFFWTKSTDQIIENSITLENGIIIDELNTKYLNDLSESDYLYTTMEEIPTKFGKLHFENFQTGGSITVEGRESINFVIINDSLIINEKLRIENLTTQNLFLETYDQIPISVIMKEEIASFVFPDDLSFETIQINDRLIVDNLNVQFINELNVSEFFERAMYINNSYQIKHLKMPKFEIDYFLSNRINEIETNNLLTILKNADSDIMQNLTIDGDLKIDGNMQVDYINNQSASYYLKRLAEVDVIIKSEDIFDNIIVHNDLMVNLLQGMQIENFVQSILLKSREQTIPGQFSFYNIRVNNLRTNIFNNYNLSNLLFIDDPLIFEGNVTFINLFMKGDVVAEQLNGYNVTELYENFLTIPSTRITNLILHGNISWETPLTGSNSLSYLFNNAVTKNTDQVISEDTIFKNNVYVSSIKTSETINGLDIEGIVSDAVISKTNSKKDAIMIKGQKTFKRGLIVDNLVVESNIGIPTINGWNILHLNASIVRKFNNETVSGQTIFVEDITIGTLFVNGNVHGMPLDGLVKTLDILPNTIHFKQLHVRGNISSVALDRIKFNDFMKDRVTIHGNHIVYGNLQFNGQIEVTDRVSVLSINDIKPSELVLNQDEYDQIISGSKTFLTNLVVEDNVHVPLINDMDMINEYNTGILNDEHVEIFGDIIFETNVEISTNTTVSGLINGIDLTYITKELEEQEKNGFFALRQNETIVETMISRSLNASSFLPDIFFYFEIEEKLMIRVPNIHKVYPINIESITKLNMYGSELGRYCGLPDDCLCITQFVAEIVEKGCEVWKINSSQIVYNFHEPNGVFGINVVTNTVSSSVQCSGRNPETESTSISWMTPVESVSRDVSGSVSDGQLKVSGFLSDVKVFTYNNNVYVVLALYYDALRLSHKMDSLIYKLDLKTKEIALMQRIRTNGAWAIEVFNVPTQGPHLLIGCIQYPAKSQLYKFNPFISKFELLTTFMTGGNRYVKSLIQENECFVLLDDSGTNSVHIFRYDFKFFNFYRYQSLYHESRINGIEVFYAGEPQYSDAYVIITTENGQFFLYEYMFLGKFQLKVHQWLDGVQTMVPFFFAKRHYIFIGTNANSTIYRIIHQGPHQT